MFREQFDEAVIRSSCLTDIQLGPGELDLQV